MYKDFLTQKVKMYEEVMSRQRLVADDVVMAFPDVNAGWFDTSIVVNNVEAYFFCFSDINDCLYEFVDWLATCLKYDTTEASVSIDCETEHVVLNMENLPVDQGHVRYASLGLLWWYDDSEREPQIQYCVVNIQQFISRTYMALLHCAISLRYRILAWWNDEFMRTVNNPDLLKYDCADFLEMETQPNDLSKRTQLLFYNKIKNLDLNDMVVDNRHWPRDPRKWNTVDVYFLQSDQLVDFTGREIPDIDATADIQQIKRALPDGIALFAGRFDINVTRRHPDVKNQTPYTLQVPILIKP